MWIREKLSALAYAEAHRDQYPKPINIETANQGRDVLNAAEDYLSSEMLRVARLTNLPTVRRVSEIMREDKVRGAVAFLKTLPERWQSLPRCAEDIRQMFKNEATGAPPADGEYTIFLNGNGNMVGVKLYCIFPSKGDQSLARSYITLRNAGNGSNYSHWPVSNVSPDGKQYYRSGDDLRTRYDKIAFDPQTKLVDTKDTSFATTVGKQQTDHSGVNLSGPTFTFAEFAAATASNHILNANSQDRQPFGEAHIDLSGTAFQIDPSVEWEHEGEIFGYIEKPSEANRFQRCAIYASGTSGWGRPKGGNLRLKLVE